MKKIYATLFLTALLISVGWLVAMATTVGEQTVLDAMNGGLTGLPGDWTLTPSSEACTNTVDWTGLTCDIDNTITSIDLPNLGIFGEMPTSFVAANLANLTTLDLSYNALFSNDVTVDSFISGFQGDWKDTQVVAPIAVNASAISDDAILVVWTPDPDYGNGLTQTYNVYITQTSGSGYTFAGSVTGFTGLAVSGLFPEANYFFVVETTAQTPTLATIVSGLSAEASAQTLALTGEGGGGSSGDSNADNEACYIATAAYGSYLDPHVQALRDFRDNVLLKSALGRELVEVYYRTSPPLAEFIRTHEGARTISRIALTPVVFGVAFPGVTFAMAFGIGIWGGVWMRKRRVRKPGKY